MHMGPPTDYICIFAVNVLAHLVIIYIYPLLT
jgi:hypothetical protein